MQKTIDAMVSGHICLDITPVFPEGGARNVSELLKPGKLVNVKPAGISLGGPVSNTGLAMRRFELSVAVSAGAGDDAFGRLLVEKLREYGTDSAIKLGPGEPTSYTIVLAPPGIDRIFLHCPGKNDTFRREDIDYETVKKTRLLHLGYPPLMRSLYEGEGRVLAEIFEHAKRCDVTTSLDMSLPDPHSPSGQAPWPRILERALPHVDIFMPSIEEIFFMLEREHYLEHRAKYPDADLVDHIDVEHYRRLAARALTLGCGICVIKTGRRGYYLRSSEAARLARFGSAAPADPARWGNQELWAQAYRIERIVSATGSGDSSIAGFLTGFLKGYPPERCMKLGCAAGRFDLTALDALSGLPPWAGVESFVEENHPCEDARLPADHFTWDAARGVFAGLSPTANS